MGRPSSLAGAPDVSSYMPGRDLTARPRDVGAINILR